MANRIIGRVSAIAVAIVMCTCLLSAAVAYQEWFQTSCEQSHSGYSPGISMYPMNEFPRPSGGMFPTYAWMSSLSYAWGHSGNIFTHIAAWYEGTQTEEHIRVAFTTSNDVGKGAIWMVDSDGDDVAPFPKIYQNPANGAVQGNTESSIAVYKDMRLYGQQGNPFETLLVAAAHDLSNPNPYDNPNELHCLELDGDFHWYCDLMDWESVHCSPIIYRDPEDPNADWGDSEDDYGNDDDFVYTFQYDATNHRTRVIAVDLTIDMNGYNEIDPTYVSEWFEDEGMDYRPSYSTPVIRAFPSETQGRLFDYYMFFLLDEYEWSNVWLDYVLVGTRCVAVNIYPWDVQAGDFQGEYETFFNIQLPIYGELEIPNPPYDPETHDLRYTVNMDPAAVWMTEDEYYDWYGFVFGTDMGSTGTGKDLFFVEIDGTISESYNLQYPFEPFGVDESMTNPLVIGSPAVRENPSAYIPEEIFVCYKDRTTGLIGVAYTDDISEIVSNEVLCYPFYYPNREYHPHSPVITDEFLYVSYKASVDSSSDPYYRSGMVYANLETLQNNESLGVFHALPWTLFGAGAQCWEGSPAILQVSSTKQYIYVGSSDLNYFGGYLWRMET